MNGFSTVDGFVEITESLAEMIKFMANEPSVGLFYVQKHTQKAVPNVINLSNHVVEKSREATLHAEDMEDSITMVKSMKECGFAIADDMIKDITNSLTLMSGKQAKRGLIQSHGSGSSFQMTGASSWGAMSWSWGQGSGDVKEDGSNYFSTVIKSARQKASNFKWIHPQSDEPQKPFPSPAHPPLSAASVSTSSVPDAETDELTLSRQMADELLEEQEKEEEESFMSANYDDFKADKESKLEQWLEGTEGRLDKNKGESDTAGL